MGGYIEESETPEETLRREIREELNIEVESFFYLGVFTGTGFYKEYEYPTLCFAYFAELKGEIKLNEENSEYARLRPDEIEIAFDSNQKILEFIKKKFTYDLDKIKKLIFQLDATANLNEQSLYKAMLDGYISKVEENGELIAMGWIFPRQTMLRNQAVVEDMIVDDKYRGKGLGEKILLDLISWAKGQGVEVVELTTNPKRLAANGLYQKVGFKLHETNHYLLKL